MSTEIRTLDTPDGLTVKEVDNNGSRALSFYTGRWEIEFSPSEVMELIDELNSWLSLVQERTP